MTATQDQARQYEKNHVLFKEGDPAPDFYVLLAGKLAVFRKHKFVRSMKGRGIFVGEMGALLGFKRSATIITLEPSTLISVPNNVENIFLHRPDIGLKLLQSLRHRLSETYDRAEKLWEMVLKGVVEIIVYEATQKVVSRKMTALGELEAERTKVGQMVSAEMSLEEFEFQNIGEFLRKLDIEAEYEKHLREKYPHFKYIDLKKMKEVWKLHTPDSPKDQLQHCLDLAAGLNELTDFMTSFGAQDEETGSEENELLESSIPLDRRIAILKSVAQQILTPKKGIDKMKQINRDVDIEIEEAGRSEQRTSRTYSLSDFAKRIEIGTDYAEELRKEFWRVSLKM